MTSASDWIDPSIQGLLRVNPGDWPQMAEAIEWLESPPGFIFRVPGAQVKRRSIAMFVSAINYAVKHGAVNASYVSSTIQRCKSTPRSVVTAGSLVFIAREIGRQVNAGTAVLQLPEKSTTSLEVQVPSAMETLIQVAINWGDNPMDAGHRDQLVTYVRFAADLYILGHWLHSGVHSGIGKFLAENPWASAARLVYEISRDSGSRPEKARQVNELNGQFASVINWRRYHRLHVGEA